MVPAKQVWNTDWDACPEEWVPTEHDIVWVLEVVFGAWGWKCCDFSLQNDGHDDSINSDSLTKDNASLKIAYLTKFFDLIRGALTAAPRIVAPVMKIPLNKDERLPCGTDDWCSESYSNTEIGPCVRTDSVEQIPPILIGSGHSDNSRKIVINWLIWIKLLLLTKFIFVSGFTLLLNLINFILISIPY